MVARQQRHDLHWTLHSSERKQSTQHDLWMIRFHRVDVAGAMMQDIQPQRAWGEERGGHRRLCEEEMTS